MCGLAGLLRLDGTSLAAPERVRSMAARLVHRGPDSAGEHFDGPIAFGFRRLSVIDLETGSQPMSSLDGSLVVMQNGEIYNYLELRAELEGRGQVFRTESDTEVLLHGYRVWGVSMLERLRGMFALVLWDREGRRLLVARDRLGQKPLFWSLCRDRGELAFASQLQALLPWIGRRRINAAALDDFLTFSVVPGPRSILEGVHKLAPAHFIVLDVGNGAPASPEPRRYWRPPVPAAGACDGGSVADGGEVAEQLKERLEESVRLRLRSDVPIGTFLSGGVDSTVITALAARHRPRLDTFSVGFADPRFDEAPVARRTAERLGTRHHEEYLDATSFSPDELPRLVRLMDEPFGDSSFLPTFWLSRAARQHVTVALSGDGGDELFAGYTRYRTFHRLERLARLPAGLLRFAEEILKRLGRRRLAKACRLARRDEIGRLLGLLTYFDQDDKARLYSSAWRSVVVEYDSTGSRATIGRQLAALPPELSGLDRFLQRDLAASLVDDGLVKVDRASMACSLEVRSPFLDHRVVELAMSLPASLKVRGGESKALLKDAFADLLPGEVRHGAKRGFEVPFGVWFARRDWRDWLVDVLAEETLRRRGLFEPAPVLELRDALLDDPEARRQPISAYQLRHRVWMLALFELWFGDVIEVGE